MVDITGGTTSCMFKTYKREKQRLNKKNRPADHVAKFIPSNLYRDREFALQAIRWNAEVWAELPSAGRGSGPPVPPAVRRGPHLPWRGIRLVREAEATRIRIR